MSDKKAVVAKKILSKKQKVPKDKALIEQYNVIREDVLKLRKDLTDGYDMARGMVEKKGFFSQLLKSK